MKNDEISAVINNDEAKISEIDWTKAWGNKYPILLEYQSKVDIQNYALKINEMLDKLKADYNFNELDAMLVLKDILYQVWKGRKNNKL